MPHYFDPAPEGPSRPSTVPLRLTDVNADLVSDRGVFSASSVDAGTVELLRSAPLAGADPAGTVLDLGCGYGPIAVTVARRWPRSQVWAVDVNERAVHLAGLNAEAMGLTNVHAATPDRVPGGLTFDRICSNPPIRIGKEALHDLLRAWLDRLAPDGRAWLVVHKHLGSDSLAAWLRGEGHDVAKVASRKGYRILEVVRR